MENAVSGGPRPSDKYIPWLFVLFFSVITLVLGGLVTIAVSTDRGVVTEDAYGKGLRYNDIIARQQAQDALGWQGVISIEPAPHGMAAVFSLLDKDKRPITQADVRATFIRPTQSGHDVTVPLLPQASGAYRGAVTLPLPGLWEAHVAAQVGDKKYQMVKRLSVP